jgi:hypothetical protein
MSLSCTRKIGIDLEHDHLAAVGQRTRMARARVTTDRKFVHCSKGTRRPAESRAAGLRRPHPAAGDRAGWLGSTAIGLTDTSSDLDLITY